jgi:hypothetical protein
VSAESCSLEVMAEDREPEGGLHLYTQLSRRMGAIEECIALYESQRAVLKEIEDEKVETISRLARDKMEIMWDLQDLKLHLEDQCRKWQGKFLVATHNCAAEPTSAPGPPGGTVSCFEIVYFIYIYIYIHIYILYIYIYIYIFYIYFIYIYNIYIYFIYIYI